MRVFLVRHGETEDNLEDSITGQMDVSLNSRGVEQAEKTADRLESTDFASAYSSDLERAYETAKIIAERHGIHPERHREFREINFGEMEGRPKNEWRELVGESTDSRLQLKPRNGENLMEAGERFMDKLNELGQKHQPQDNILVAGHGVVTKAVIMKIQDFDGDKYQDLEIQNTSITELIYDENDGWQVVRVNDKSQ